VPWIASIVAGLFLPGLKKLVSEDVERFRAACGMVARVFVPVALALTAVLCTLPWLVGGLLNDPSMRLLLFLAALHTPFLAARAAAYQLLGGVSRFSNASAVWISGAALGTLAAGGFLLLGLGAPGAMAGSLLGTALSGATGVVLVLRRRRCDGPDHLPEGSTARVLHWTTTWLPFLVTLRTVETLDVWLVAALLSDGEARSLYGVAYALARFPLVIAHGLGDAIFPRVSGALSAADPHGAGRAATKAMRLLLVVFALTCCLTAGAARELTVLLFGAKYAASADVLVVLAPAIFLASWMHLSLRLVAAADRPAWVTLIALGMLLLAGGMGVALIGAWGIVGAAWASLATFAAGAVAAGLAAWRRLRVAPPVLTLVRCTIAGAGVFAAARLWPTPGPLVLLKAMAIAVLFAAAMVAMGEAAVGERLRLRRLFAQAAPRQEGPS